MIATLSRLLPLICTEDGKVTLKIRRSARSRRLSLRWDPTLPAFILGMPFRVSMSEAGDFLTANAAWMARQYARLPPVRGLHDQDCIWINGREYRIHHHENSAQNVLIEGQYIHVFGPLASLQTQILTFAHHLAVTRLPEDVKFWNAKMDAFSPIKVTIRPARTRWGSCHRDGRIMLNWRLILTPRDVCAYVIVHELAHLRHFNHGPQFWHYVETYFPQRRHAQHWLKIEGPRILGLK